MGAKDVDLFSPCGLGRAEDVVERLKPGVVSPVGDPHSVQNRLVAGALHFGHDGACRSTVFAPQWVQNFVLVAVLQDAQYSDMA